MATQVFRASGISLRAAGFAAAGLGVVLLGSTEARAACNLIPIVRHEVPSTKGRINGPITAPGEQVTLTLTPCEVETAFDPIAANNEVAITFVPPGSGGTTDISVIAGVITVEHCLLDGTCLPCTPAACNTLRFVTPDTDDDLAPAADGIGLAGPARIRVTKDAGATELVVIDDLYQPTAGCNQEPETVFQKFTVLPEPNRVVDLCDPAPGTPCTGAAGRLLVTVDGDGNLLIPLDHTDVLPLGPGAPVAILEGGSTTYPAFTGFPDSISDAVASVIGTPQEPEDLLRAFTLDGRPLPPLLVLNDNGGMLGTADAVTSVIRVLRVDAANNPLFDITDRLYTPGPANERKGPIVINPAFEVALGATVPIKGLRSTGRAVAFGRDETLAAEPDLNSDGDEDDRVAQVIDVASGSSTNTGRAVAEVRSGPVGVPEIAIAGTTVAFLESESAQNADANGDGDELDAILRVYDGLGNPRTSLAPGAGIPAAPALSVNGRSLQISDPLVFFRTNEGSPSLAQEIVDLPTGDNVASLAVELSRDGANVYVISNNHVVVFARDLSSGELTYLQTIGRAYCGAGKLSEICGFSPDSACDTSPGAGDGNCMSGAEMDSAFSLVVSPDDAQVYVADVSDRVATLARDPGTGILTFSASEPIIGGVFIDTAISPDGRDLYIADLAFTLRRARRDPLTGVIAAELLSATTVNPVSLAMSHDGTSVYVGGVSELEVFSRDALTGNLTSIQFLEDGIGGVSGLTGFLDHALVVSPDDRHVYVSGRESDAIALFDRDPGTGALTFVQTFDNGVGGVEGLDGPAGLAMSPDGARLYAASGGTHLASDGGAIAAFDRDTATGTLTFAGAELDDTSGVFWLNAGGRPAVSADGAHLYVVGGSWLEGGSGFGDGLSVFHTGSRLRVFDASAGMLRPAAETDASVVAVSTAGRAAMLRPEGNRGGGDLNGDGDTDDEIAYFYDGAAGAGAVPQSLGVAAKRVAIAGNLVALTIDEAANGGSSLSSDDNDTNDDVVAWWRAGDPVPVPTNHTAGNSAVGPSIGVTSTASGEFLAFLEPETGNGVQDLNDDGDSTDVVLSVIKPSKSFKSTLPRIAAVDFRVEGDVVAFRANEAQQGDLNGDGDPDDAVMYAVDLRDPNLRPISTHQAAAVCNLPGCEPFTPYKIRGDTISFLSNELAQDDDLDGNGLIEDTTVLHVFNVRSRRLQRFEMSAVAPLLDPFPKTLFDKPVLYNEAIDVDDIDNDGFTNDVVVRVAGDVDDDGAYDDFDTCVEAKNADQIDGDVDLLGDFGCDSNVTPCPATPLAGCKTPTAAGKSSFSIVDDGDPTKDRIAWKWGSGSATTVDELGDPVSGAVLYALCVYDASGATQPLMTSLLFPGGTCDGKNCWKTTGTSGYKYKDKLGSPNGLQTVTLKSGPSGKATINVKGRGANLVLPSLPLTPSVLVQFVASTPGGQACWDASFGGNVQANGPDQFKAKSD